MFECILELLKGNLKENYPLVMTSSFLATISTFLYSHLSDEDDREGAAHILKEYKADLKSIPKNKWSSFLEIFYSEYKECSRVKGIYYQLRVRLLPIYLSYKLFSGGLQNFLLVILLINVSNVLVTIICASIINYIAIVIVLLIFIGMYSLCLYAKAFLCERIGKVFEKTILRYKEEFG